MRPRLVLLLFAALASSCATYRIAIEPTPPELTTRFRSDRGALAITVQSTYAPWVDGELSSTDLYPRDRGLGVDELERYRRAFIATQQFDNVTAGAAGNGLHCALTIVSGREPAHEGRRALSILLTLGLLSHEQREIVRIEAVVSAPGRAPASYRFEGHITTDAVDASQTRLRRSWMLCGPENDLARAIVAQMAKDGWLETAATGGQR